MSRKYRVDGMTCGGCAASVTRAIRAVQPDARVDVSLEERTVTVEGDIDDGSVEKAVTDAGFDYAGPV